MAVIDGRRHHLVGCQRRVWGDQRLLHHGHPGHQRQRHQTFECVATDSVAGPAMAATSSAVTLTVNPAPAPTTYAVDLRRRQRRRDAPATAQLRRPAPP